MPDVNTFFTPIFVTIFVTAPVSHFTMHFLISTPVADNVFVLARGKWVVLRWLVPFDKIVALRALPIAFIVL
jgi:hypothetical protein